MTLTPEQLRQNAAAMIAFAEGKQIEAQVHSDSSKNWTLLKDPAWNFNLFVYRPKPTPISRPWSKTDSRPVFNSILSVIRKEGK